MPEDEVFFVGQKAFIEHEGKVLVLTDMNGWMDFPGGKIQKGERDLTESLKREVREEVGLEIEVGEPFVAWFNFFDPPHRLAGKQIHIVGYRCRLLRGEIALSDEHTGHTWVTKSQLDTLEGSSRYKTFLKKYFDTTVTF